MADDF
jgi:hypothetical protein